MTAPAQPMPTPAGWDGLLDPDEAILWQGRPDPGMAVDAGHLVMGLFGAAFAGFALFWMIMAAQGGGWFWMFGLLHFAVGLGVMLGGPVGGALRRRRSWYTLTNRRAFIATDLPWQGRKLESWPITPEADLALTDHGTLSSITFAERPVRTRRGIGTDRIGFDRITDGRQVLALMRAIQRDLSPAPAPAATGTP